MITNMLNLEKMAEQLHRDEGLRLKPYYDTTGKLTIGVGRNLDDRGITHAEAGAMLRQDIQDFDEELRHQLPWTANLDEARYAVLLNMAFNMGVGGLMKFKNTLRFVENSMFSEAADAMLDSKWAAQVGQRAVRLAQQMLTGEWQ